jgi:predicted SnoaL-like aldol condensation-catalyzing enzyme
MSNRLLTIGLAILVVTLTTQWMGACAQQNSSEEAQEEQNKATILRVYDEVFGQGKTELVNDLFSKNYIQHDPMLPNGPEGLIRYVEMLKSQSPALVLTIKHVLTDGDLVAVHWHSSTTPDNESTGQAGFDLYRLDNGTIVEHWDVIQNVSAKTASGNSMFSDLYKGASASSE